MRRSFSNVTMDFVPQSNQWRPYEALRSPLRSVASAVSCSLTPKRLSLHSLSGKAKWNAGARHKEKEEKIQRRRKGERKRKSERKQQRTRWASASFANLICSEIRKCHFLLSITHTHSHTHCTFPFILFVFSLIFFLSVSFSPPHFLTSPFHSVGQEWQMVL